MPPLNNNGSGGLYGTPKPRMAPSSGGPTPPPQSQPGSPNAVNPNIPKATIPPSSLFGGKTFQDWGRGVVNWGSGANDALARICTLTKAEIQRLGITQAQAEAALNFYKQEFLRNPGNATAAAAAARIKLMEHILSQL